MKSGDGARSAAMSAALVAWACASAASAAAPPVRIVTSIPPLAMIASELGGDRVEVRSILPPGADPHTFEPRPSDAIAIANASIIVMLGSSIDDWIGDEIVAPDTAAVVRLDAAGDDEEHDHAAHDEGHDEAEHATQARPGAGHDHAEHDPHVWLDPLWVRDHAVTPIHRALATADPAGAARYGVAARAMVESLSDLDDDMRESFLSAATRNFLAWHPAWGRFARRFGLNSVGSLGEGEGREPSLRAMIGAVRAGRAAGVRAVLVEPQTDSRQAAVLADELGVPLITVDPLGDARAASGIGGAASGTGAAASVEHAGGAAASGTRPTYRDLMLFNLRAFERALAVEKKKPASPAPVSAIPAPPAVP